MGASAAPVIVITLFWIVIGGVIPWFVPKNENKGIIQTMQFVAIFCVLYIWLCTYMMQMNPLFGPLIDNKTLTMIHASKW
ncbi:V-type proton ATPase subunit e 1-like [Limulus polyphemus]|uniref:V-type proton ATPase subunit e 1-like n=1 Tax=Limulus polyphemus TaxID=6850 RepID=A0ABM1SSF0_LIMPO|nr:V-type proton ATPase subunit e 1-like [Limulus polyphemus]